MKTLYLLRHAHAELKESSYSDFDRPLDERGKQEAEAVATYLQEKKLTFDFVMCSAALRTQETLEPLRPVIGTQEIELSPTFYNLSAEDILSSLKHISDQRARVLYIGQNPGVAVAMLRCPHIFPAFLKEGIHPATLVGFQFSLDKWEDLEWGAGSVTNVFQPVRSPEASPSPRES